MSSPISGNVSKDFDVNRPSTSLYTSATTTGGGGVKKLGDQDTFLKLLVAQLKYQDPSKPADSTAFLAQTAQFTQVEKLGAIADMLSSQQLIGASSLVGRTVIYQDATGASLTGVVTSTKLNGDSEPMLVVGNMDVPLSKVTEVQQTPVSDAKEA
jgi:flagellar basal-body rod modification protein FlgD